jgi:hypothetical protein
MERGILAALVATTAVTLPGGGAADGPYLPPALESFLIDEARVTASDRRVLLGGQPVVKLLDAEPDREVAVLGAVWVQAPAARYVERLKEVEEFERGGASRRVTRISDPPRLDDFAELTLGDRDFDDLKTCTVGNCVLKLGEDAVRTIRAEVDWRRATARADANAAFRRLALSYVEGYREGGNSRLAVYRDKDRPTFSADEFRALVDRLPRLAVEWPDLKQYLLHYPAATLSGSTDFMYWEEVRFGLRPTIRINHLVTQGRGDRTIVASKTLYASHYFWTGLEIRVLLADPRRGPGFWLLSINRSRSDGLGGFGRGAVRARARSEAQDGMRAALASTKAKLESVR